jgi:hypothetical protein
MRAAVTTILGFLIIGLVALTLWPMGSATPFDPSPPGQYPLGAPRPEWPATERVKAYKPAASMGSDTVGFVGSLRDPKAVCALSTTCPEIPFTQ